MSGSPKRYPEKRDFDRPPEPNGSEGARSGTLLFVIHKHSSRNLHYDFRLEIAGVLKSWAVPRGPSLDPAEKRLAILTDDHPMDYASFEGRIPEGEYGSGTVLVWDTGTYSNLKQHVPMEDAFEAGRVTVWLEGKKLQGGFVLIRTDETRKKQWLLVKMKDEKADPGSDIVSERPESALTGRTLDDIE